MIVNITAVINPIMENSEKLKTMSPNGTIPNR
jgi:hypothetical protein